MLDNPLWHTWWVWVAGGFVLGILEILIPGYIFLGFAAGAVAMGLILALGVFNLGGAWMLLIFAGFSLVAYVALSRWMPSGRGAVKIIKGDINDNTPKG